MPPLGRWGHDSAYGPATIVIENKWNCGLGDRQLERYGNYLANLGGSMGSHRTCLVYLTRNGEIPLVSPAIELVCLSHSIHTSRLIQSTLALLPDTAPPARFERTPVAILLDIGGR
jgi:hypothetical protein